jgi:hypothetical protein
VPELTELEDLLKTWRNYIAKQMPKTVQESSPGYLAGLAVCSDQLEAILNRMKDAD